MLSKKLILTATLILSIIITSFTGVYASSNASGIVTLKESSQKATGTYKVGDEITLTVSIAVKEMDGVNILLANKLGYDKNLLEYKGITLKKGWILISDEKGIFIERNDLKNDTGKLCELKFKVIKEFKETKISLEEIDASSGTGTNIHFLDNNVNSPSIKIKANEPVPSATKVETQTIKPVETNTNKEQTINKTQTTSREEIERPKNETTQNVIKTEVPTNSIKENNANQSSTTVEENATNTENIENTINVENIEEQIQETANKVVEQEISKLTSEQKENISEEKMDSIMEIIGSCITKVVSAIVEAIFKTLSLS